MLKSFAINSNGINAAKGSTAPWVGAVEPLGWANIWGRRLILQNHNVGAKPVFGNGCGGTIINQSLNGLVDFRPGRFRLCGNQWRRSRRQSQIRKPAFWFPY